MSGVLLDVNILVALSWDRHEDHVRAHRRFQSVHAWSTTPVTENGLVRLLLTEAVVGRHVEPGEAFEQVRALRRVPGWSWIPDAESPATWSIGRDAVRGRRQVTDVHLVNVAASAGLRLATFDARIAAALPVAQRHHVDVWA